jgi:hypothetical protein
MSNEISIEVIKNKIFDIRGEKVMLDRDLAELYKVETRVLNQAVKRNINRFPKEFMFELNREEIMRISQFVISLKYSKRVLAFTEYGIVMLASVLNSSIAININIQIVKAFIQLRKMAIDIKELKCKIEKMENKYDEQFNVIFKAIKELLHIKNQPKKKIGFRV